MTVQDFLSLKPGDRVRWYGGAQIEGTVTSNGDGWLYIRWDDNFIMGTPLDYIIAIEHVCRWMQRVREWDNPHSRSTNGVY